MAIQPNLDFAYKERLLADESIPVVSRNLSKYTLFDTEAKLQVFSGSGRQALVLASGRTCELSPIRNDLIRNYYLLAFPRDQGQPSSAEVTEMLNLGIDCAQRLAAELLGDPEAFTILYSGYSARREKGWHVHIVLLGNRWMKAWLYLVLAGKNLAQAFGLRRDDSPRIKHEH